MSLTVKHAGTTQARSATPPLKGEVIRVTPTISTSAYSAGDVLFLTTEIPNAVQVEGGASKLLAVSILSDSGAVQKDISIVFMQTSKDLIGALSPGSSGGPAISDANALAANFLGGITFDTSNVDIDLGGVKLFAGGGKYGQSTLHPTPIILKADANSTSVHFAGLAKEAATYEGVDDLHFIFHVEYL
tara:strand:+ start:80 stop:643 length:564 start_codon:yes stop_codon:yes gene_type:complete